MLKTKLKLNEERRHSKHHKNRILKIQLELECQTGYRRRSSSFGRVGLISQVIGCVVKRAKYELFRVLPMETFKIIGVTNRKLKMTIYLTRYFIV